VWLDAWNAVTLAFCTSGWDRSGQWAAHDVVDSCRRNGAQAKPPGLMFWNLRERFPVNTQRKQIQLHDVAHKLDSRPKYIT